MTVAVMCTLAAPAALAAMPQLSSASCLAPASASNDLGALRNLSDTRATGAETGHDGDAAAHPLANVVQVMCLAALANGDIGPDEASRIDQIAASARLTGTIDGDLVDLVGAMDRPALDAALQSALSVMVADGGIDAEEQAFFAQLTEASALPQHTIRQVLGLID